MGSIFTFSLQSGSNGNAIYVETPDARLLFDAGISGKQAQLRMAQHGRDIRDCDAVLVSHDHADHVRCAGIFARKFELPLLISGKTFKAVSWGLGLVGQVEHFETGQTLRFGQTAVETIPTPHDAADGCAFVVSHGGARLGILTDLGHVFAGLADVFAGLDAAYLETNYDPDMLSGGPYPEWLKKRIAGPAGHLSNGEAGDLTHGFGGRLRWLMLSHLSEENNTPATALTTVKKHLGRSLTLAVASRYETSAAMEV
ncbi:MAG: MBL fold metallo-hydrolase [Phycisphaerae bacterium]|nr:MBL fold metallo-hydrolase [Phycisphaerae bacterium]